LSDLLDAYAESLLRMLRVAGLDLSKEVLQESIAELSSPAGF
jgi:hypothetical protein